MEKTLPAMDNPGGSRGPRRDDSDLPKTVIAGAGEQPSAPRPQTPPASSPPPWTPPPQPSAPPSPFQPVPDSAASPRTVLMGTPAPQIPLAWLAVVSGPGADRGKTFVLRPETVVGRAANIDVSLSGDVTISSQHIKVRLEQKEGSEEDEPVFMLYDLASANGTFAGTRENYRDDASRVYRCELHPGDHVLLGETTLVFLRA